MLASASSGVSSMSCTAPSEKPASRPALCHLLYNAPGRAPQVPVTAMTKPLPQRPLSLHTCAMIFRPLPWWARVASPRTKCSLSLWASASPRAAPRAAGGPESASTRNSRSDAPSPDLSSSAEPSFLGEHSSCISSGAADPSPSSRAPGVPGPSSTRAPSDHSPATFCLLTRSPSARTAPGSATTAAWPADTSPRVVTICKQLGTLSLSGCSLSSTRW
mmetsp:Transcript_90379/g.269659  ORF Transcript_90379/g.269659 Transcript_90379/m.269659 type:complete len:218 (+) Transcript_90379:315-968(+)